MFSNFNIQKVLIAPLDWGLGHATRCIPIINSLLQNGYEVIIAADDITEILLKKEFPTLQFIKLAGYKIKYAKSKWLLPLKILQQVPKILSSIKNENKWLNTIIDTHKIDLVISDNRYGLYSKKIPCVFITHQLTIKMPFLGLQKLVQKINYKYINKFTACWIPDFEGENNVAGVLSHPNNLPKIPIHYLGILSRFTKQENILIEYDYCILLSGPEPQRTLLEEKILADIKHVNAKILLLRGKPDSTEKIEVAKNITIENHLAGKELAIAIQQSKYIISRSGYTTIMELLALEKKAILIPTYGQTEQEYLAERLMQQNWCYTLPQQQFNFINAIEAANNFKYNLRSLPKQQLQTLIPQLVQSLKK